jgi:ParB-like chromosome segregation protein Spo0J
VSIEIKCSYDELVSIKELKPHPKNPNSHSEAQIARLGKILSYQGFRNPIIVSRNSGYIVSGHGRLLAAQKIGLKKVPINYQDFSHAFSLEPTMRIFNGKI